MLDPSACGANLVLSNSNMTVTNGVNKKWNAVRASTCFSNGVHYWEVHITNVFQKISLQTRHQMVLLITTLK